MDQVTVTLPDGSTRQVPAGAPVRAVAEGISPRLARAALAATVGDLMVDLSHPLEEDAPVRIVTRDGPEALELYRHRHRASAGRRRHRPVPGGPVRHRAADRGRVLLRLRRRPSVRARGPRGDRGEDARDRAAGPRLRAQDDAEGGGQALLRRARRAPQGRADRGEGRTGRLVLHHRRRVHGLLHRPPRALQRRPQGVPGADELERLLEGGRPQPADAAHLRLPPSSTTRPSRSTCGGSRRPESGTTASSDASSGCSRSTTGRRARRSGSRTAPPSGTCSPSTCGRPCSRKATSSSGPRSSTTSSSGRPRGTGRTTKRTCCGWSPRGETYSLKPMNCPGHMLVFASEVRSYRDLPIRYHDQSVLHRDEASGVLAGLTRARQFCQDDAHCFVAPDQIGSEVERLLRLVQRVYADFQLEFLGRAVDAARHVPGGDRHLGSGRGPAQGGPRGGRPGLPRRGGRGQLLRPQDRLPRRRRHRQELAVRHDSARATSCRSGSSSSTSARTTPSTAPSSSTGPSSAASSASSPCSSSTTRVRSRSGWLRCRRPSYPSQTATATTPSRWRPVCGRRACGSRWMPARRKWGIRSARRSSERSRTCWSPANREAANEAVAVRHRRDGDLGASPVGDFIAAALDEVRWRGARDRVPATHQ